MVNPLRDFVEREKSPEMEPEEQGVAEDVESLRKSLEEERAKAERYLANWQRAQADFANYKKHMEQEREESIKFANRTLILGLLPAIGDFERALELLPAELAELPWVDGIRVIYRKLRTSLEAQGLSQIKALGESFDPSIHQAVMEGEGEEGKVIEELRIGYKLHDRVISPALVVVGKRNKAKEE